MIAILFNLAENSNAVAQEMTIAQVKNSKWKSTVKVEWGNENKMCKYFGICEISSITDRDINMKQATFATIERKRDGIALSVEENDLNELSNSMIYTKLHGMRGVKFDTSFEIPIEIARTIGFRCKITIPAGNYSVSSDEGLITILFTEYINVCETTKTAKKNKNYQ